MALRLKRGTNAERLAYIPEAGELIYVTNYSAAGVSPLWVGDGTTVGGNEVSSGAGGGGLADLVDDLSPQLGGDLDLNNSDIIGAGNIAIAGTISASSFDGPVVGDLTGSVFADDSTPIIDAINKVGVLNNINFDTNLTLTDSNTGVGPGNVNIRGINGQVRMYLVRDESGDLAVAGQNYGRMYFGRDDDAGLAFSGFIQGGYDGFKFKLAGSDGLFGASAAVDIDLDGNLENYTTITSPSFIGDVTGTVSDISNHSLSGLSDVTSDTPSTGQVLKWNGSAWAPGSDNSGVGGSGSFELIVSADDSAQRLIGPGESLAILGGTGITTASDAEGAITITGFSGAYGDLTGAPTTYAWSAITSTPTTLAGYGITDAATSAQGALADTALQPADVGSFTLTGSTLDTSDSSAITITPAVTMNSDLTVENNLVVTNTVTAERFVSTSTGTPVIEAAANLELTAGNAVVITSSPLRLASFTTTERNALAAQNGDMIYNTTDNKLQGYQNGGWINLDGTV